MVQRRTYLALLGGGVVSLAGCLNMIDTDPGEDDQTDSDNTNSDTSSDTETDSPNYWGGNPVTVGVTQEVTATQELHDRVEAALTYWEDNADQYAGQSVEFDYQPNEDEVDIEIIVVEDIVDCGEHDSDLLIVGCAPILQGPPSGTVEIQIRGDLDGDHMEQVLKHEFGHVLGLTHDDEPRHIMSDDVEDRIPDYGDRTSIFESYNDAIGMMNDGNEAYAKGLELFESESFTRAQDPLAESEEAFNSAHSLFQDAAETAIRIDENEVKDICDEAAVVNGDFARSMRALHEASTSYANQDYNTGDTYVEQHQEYHQAAHDGTVRDGATVADLLGLPVEEESSSP